MAWKCNTCFSTAVERLAWIDMESGEDSDDEIGEFYCRSCGNNVEVFYDIDENDDDDTGDLVLVPSG